MLCKSLLATFVATTAAHGAFTRAFGNAQPATVVKAFGIDESTPRDGTTRTPFQADTSVIRERDAATVGVCGKTAAGPNDVAQEMATAQSTGSYAMVTAQNGVVSMTLHQVNGDGAGPYRCEFSSDMTTFQPMDVMVNVPGENSRSRARATDFPLVARMPTSLEPGVGIVRCQNSARAGPFGGCIAVQIV